MYLLDKELLILICIVYYYLLCLIITVKSLHTPLSGTQLGKSVRGGYFPKYWPQRRRRWCRCSRRMRKFVLVFISYFSQLLRFRFLFTNFELREAFFIQPFFHFNAKIFVVRGGKKSHHTSYSIIKRPDILVDSRTNTHRTFDHLKRKIRNKKGLNYQKNYKNLWCTYIYFNAEGKNLNFLIF